MRLQCNLWFGEEALQEMMIASRLLRCHRDRGRGLGLLVVKALRFSRDGVAFPLFNNQPLDVNSCLVVRE